MLEDRGLSSVAVAIQTLDFTGARMAELLRRSFDFVYAGQETGRYAWHHLYKTEQDGFGDIVAMEAQREFHFADGQILDYRIEGVEVDCKYSQQIGRWMIPPEAQGHLCLVISAEDS